MEKNRRELHGNGEAEVAGMAIERLRFVDEGVDGGLGWKDVEERFDRIANVRPGPVPVVNAVDFGYCIGMQKTPEFANELLLALRGRKERVAEITKAELHKHWHCITNPSFSSRVQLFFNLCDRNMDGRITHMEIKQAILLSTSSNKLSLTQREVEQYADLIMEKLDTQSLGYIEVSQLETLFKLNSSEGHYSTDLKSSRPDQDDPCREPFSTAEILFRTHWRRAWIVILWLIVCCALFGWKFTQYSHRKAYEVMGYCLCTAKGAAETLKFNMALILLPVCRNTVTWLRNQRPISSIIPFNDNINFHKTWMYIAIPVLLYFGERTFRAIRSELRGVKILKATIFPGKVLSLKLGKLEGFKYRSGMYVYIQCPQISPFEWISLPLLLDVQL